MPRKLDTPLDKLTRKNSGRRSRTRTERKRGRYVMSRPANGSTDIAFDATIRAAAPFQRRRAERPPHPGPEHHMRATLGATASPLTPAGTDEFPANSEPTALIHVAGRSV